MNKYRLLKKTAWAALAVLALASCKSEEWKEHYSTNGDIPTMTLAQTIESMPEYSNFVKALKTTFTFNEKNMTNVTYWDLLSESNFMTVWLPTNESVADTVWDKYTKPIREKTREEHLKFGTEFIMNHIARFSHTIGSATHEKITMLSGKGYEATPLEIAGTAYNTDSMNIRCSNGILHKLNGKIDYLPSIYEYLTTSSDYQEFGKWFAQYSKYEIDIEKSVEKGIVDGQMVYADSVMKMTSVLLDKFGYINEEDSNYIMLLPDTALFAEQFARIKDYFEYESLRDDADSLQKLYTYQAMMTDMFFNMNKAVNPHPDDSIVSTQFKLEERLSDPVPYHVYRNPKKAGGILASATDSAMCSNGKVYFYNEWPFQDNMTFLRPIKLEAEDVLLSSEFTYRPRTLYRDCFGNPLTATVMDISKASFDNWDAPYYIADNLKATYKMKVVFRRNTVVDASYNVYPVIRYYSQNRNLLDPNLEKNAVVWEASTGTRKTYYFKCGDSKNMNIADPDTVTSASFIFPNCNYKTGLDRCKVTISCKTPNKEYNTSNIWLDCIILEPVIE